MLAKDPHLFLVTTPYNLVPYVVRGCEGHYKITLNAMLARSVQTSHGYPMLVSWAILEGTVGDGLEQNVGPSATCLQTLQKQMIRLLDDSSNEGLHLLNQTLRKSEHVLGRVWTEQLSPADEEDLRAVHKVLPGLDSHFPNSTTKRAGPAPHKGRSHAPRRRCHQLLTISHPPRLDATTCRNPPAYGRRNPKRSLTPTQPA